MAAGEELWPLGIFGRGRGLHPGCVRAMEGKGEQATAIQPFQIPNRLTLRTRVAGCLCFCLSQRLSRQAEADSLSSWVVHLQLRREEVCWVRCLCLGLFLVRSGPLSPLQSNRRKTSGANPEPTR